MSKSKSLKELMAEADTLWSLAIHTIYDGKCAYTKSEGIQAHHVFLRRHNATRWNLDNGVLLSREMHAWAHAYQKEFRWWYRGKIGEERYDALEAKSREIW